VDFEISDIKYEIINSDPLEEGSFANKIVKDVR
jgi:hypothetical protein